jgi:hypothetical protein
MQRRAILTLMLCGGLSGCAAISGSRLNPFNWFGNRDSEEVALRPGELPPDPRPLVDQVTVLTLERTPSGAILRATGLPPTQGHWDGALVSETRGEPVDGILTLQFRVVPPVTPRPASTPASREVVVGRFLTNQQLQAIREIRVEAARNARAVRR